MANPKIEVEIGAVIDGLRKGFGESVKIIETLEKQALDLDKALKAATDLPEIQSLNQRLAQTKAALSQLKSAGVDPLTKATSQYNSVGIDFARIVQDAPFGIIGVGNNITQLAGSFQVLKNQTGSTSAALKQSFASIFSSGNALILGISLLTTAFTILQQKGFFKSEQDAKSLDEALKEYQETLTGVAAATLKGAQDSQKELATLKALEIQATNTSLSTKQRTDAVNELQKLYPNYFGNLTKEQILNGQVGDAYIKVTANLLAKAKAQASVNEIAQNGIELLRIETKLEEQRSKRLLETSAAQAQIDALIEKRQKDGFLTQGDLQRYDTLIKSINNANESLEEEEKLKSEISKINKENETLTAEITNQLKLGASFVKESGSGIDENNKKLKEYSDGWDKYNEQLKFSDDLTVLLAENTARLGKEVDSIFNKRVQEIKLTLPESPAALNLDKLEQTFSITPEIADLDESKITAFVLRLAEFNAQVTEVIQNGAQQTLGDFAFAIGDALASGGNVIQSAGAALLGGLAGILNQLGQLAIATGVAIAGIKEALKTLNPAVAIGAGIALVALAGFVSAKARSLGNARPKGGGAGSSVGSSGVGGGSSFVGGGGGEALFSQNRNLTGEFVVRGNDLVYVLGQAGNRINKG
jgi:hypothetical protein